MSEEPDDAVRSAPKFHVDRTAYADALKTWFERRRPEASNVAVSNIDIPVSTGFSNETVFFEVDWQDGGAQHERFVARIEQEGGALFPEQTGECCIAVGVQHRVMQMVSETSDVPVP